MNLHMRVGKHVLRHVSRDRDRMLRVVLRSTMVREHRARNHEKNHPGGQNSEQLTFHFPSSEHPADWALSSHSTDHLPSKMTPLPYKNRRSPFIYWTSLSSASPSPKVPRRGPLLRFGIPAEANPELSFLSRAFCT